MQNTSVNLETKKKMTLIEKYSLQDIHLVIPFNLRRKYNIFYIVRTQEHTSVNQPVCVPLTNNSLTLSILSTDKLKTLIEQVMRYDSSQRCQKSEKPNEASRLPGQRAI